MEEDLTNCPGFEILNKYFKDIPDAGIRRYGGLMELYSYWNSQINVISRKDLPNLYLNHVLHSLSLARIIPFKKNEKIIDIGTGGGFPGIPLAIMFPDVNFTLVDSVGKKIKVVKSVVDDLKLDNVTAIHSRAEDVSDKFHYVISRAVTAFPRFVEMSGSLLLHYAATRACHGIYSLKGGDLVEELGDWNDVVKISNISSFFEEEFFGTKRVVFLSTGKLFPLKG